MVHHRCICPVGQGGFAIEEIDNYIVVYDCGSITSPQMVESCIDRLVRRTDHVNLLFISHFDKDHVNSLRYLLSNVRVLLTVTPMIPSELKWCYGVYTNGGYTAIMDLLDEYHTERVFLGGIDNEERRFQTDKVWEWIAKSMMTQSDFDVLKYRLRINGLDLEQITNAYYVEEKKVLINNVFKDYFGPKGPNSKGLILLSQHCNGVKTGRSHLGRGRYMFWYWYEYLFRIYPLNISKTTGESSCLYVGDADMRNIANNQAIQEFIKKYRTEQILQLMQIPHHGSRYSVGKNFEYNYQALYYFLNDRTTKRLQSNKALFLSLTTQNKLLVARDVCQDLIFTKTVI